LNNGSLTVKQNIKGKAVVKVGSITGALQGATCDFTDSSTVTIAERVLDPKRMDASVEICKEDFENDWEVVNAGNSAWMRTSPSLSDFIITATLASTLASLETMIWQGVAGANAFAGFETLFLADATVVDVGTPVAITSTNVLSEMGRLKAVMTNAVKQQPDAEIILSQNVFEAFIDALGGFKADGVGANGIDGRGVTWYNGQPVSFGGIAVRRAPGMSDNTMVGTTVGNLWFGTALLSDTTTVRTLDMTDQDLSDNVRFKATFTAGIQYGAGSMVAFYQA
jgi:hypothetical protein